MIEKGRISSLQMGIIMYPTILATGVLMVPSLVAKYAGLDAWISSTLASLSGCLAVLVSLQLNKLYPAESIIQYSRSILGRVAGRVIGLICLLSLLDLNGAINREYSEFLVGNFLPRTPQLIVIAGMVLLCCLAVRSGLEVIGRCAQIFVPLVFVLLVLVSLLLTPKIDPANLLPVLDNGVKPALVGSIIPLGWFSEFALISYLLPFLKDRQKAAKWSLISLLTVTMTLTGITLLILSFLGPLSPYMVYPVLVAFRYINIADFFTHLESLLMAIWVLGVFVKSSMFLYVLVLGTAQWLDLPDYRPLVFPMGLLVTACSVWVVRDLQEMSDFVRNTAPFHLLFFNTAVPVFLLLIASVRNRLTKKKESRPA